MPSPMYAVPLWTSVSGWKVGGCSSETNVSQVLLVSAATRSVANEAKATRRPSALVDTRYDIPSPSRPPVSTLTRVQAPVAVSWRNTSVTSFPSPATRFVASDSKATYAPSSLIDGNSESESASVPELSRLTRVVRPSCRSRRNTSIERLVSSATRLPAQPSNAT